MYIKFEDIINFNQYLHEEEKSKDTIKKYMREVQEFYKEFSDSEINKEKVIEYKRKLMENNLNPSTINTKLSALNGLFRFLNHPELFVKFLKIQKKAFLSDNKELTKKEYERLVQTAYRLGKEQLALILQTIGATGIRVSELKYITKEAVLNNKACIHLKGKDRTILIPKELKKRLLSFIKKNNIEGIVFVTKNGTPISRHQIWKQMKALCKEAHVDENKVFPHNLRHLFAVTFYKQNKDIVKLSNVLGHSSIDTTKLYLASTCREHLCLLDKMRLVC